MVIRDWCDNLIQLSFEWNLLIICLWHCVWQDLPRTFPGHPWLDTPEGHAALRRVLVGYSFRDSDVGYCQVHTISCFHIHCEFFNLTQCCFYFVVVAGTKLCCGVTVTCDEDRRRRVLDASGSSGKHVSPWLLHNQLVWMPCWAEGFQRLACPKMSKVSPWKLRASLVLSNC